MEEEEEDDLYEPPPCDPQSRIPFPTWTPQENTSLYSDRSIGVATPCRPRTIGIDNQLDYQFTTVLLNIPSAEKCYPSYNITVILVSSGVIISLSGNFTTYATSSTHGHMPQGVHNIAQRPMKPATPGKRTLPHPTASRRLSLPCSVLRSPPTSASELCRGMDDMYVTFGDNQDEGLLGKPWYRGDIERKEAEKALRRINKDGCFLVRLSSAQSQLQPYTLAVLYNEHIYNIPIRALGARGYSLGKEGKLHEETFPSVVHLIDHYQQEHLYLINRQTHGRESTALLYPALC
ncbi:SH2 domain-containing protein 6 [Pelodytes ibericus]